MRIKVQHSRRSDLQQKSGTAVRAFQEIRDIQAFRSAVKNRELQSGLFGTQGTGEFSRTRKLKDKTGKWHILMQGTHTLAIDLHVDSVGARTQDVFIMA